jgi:hypothetical protein
MFTLGLLSMLLPEEFHDGEVSARALNSTKLAYDSLKSARQAFKDFSNRQQFDDFLAQVRADADPLWRIFLPSWSIYSGENDRFEELRMRGLLSQTRGAGTPPPLRLLRAKVKFLETVSQESTPLSGTQKALIDLGLADVFAGIPDSALTGLATKAGVRVSSSATYERMRKEGGVSQSINDMVWEGTAGRACRIIDLQTGALIEEKLLQDCSAGEYIFFRALEEVLALPPEELSKVFMIVAREPGKARVATKLRIPLKIVLDVVNGICSWVLQKGVASSSSGMGKENHAWNFFKDMFCQEELLFKVRSTEKKRVGAAALQERVVYQEVFASSTDYETATDFANHNVFGRVGGAMMRKCGIPALLRGIVEATCFRPRVVEFEAHGCLSSFGQEIPGTSQRKILLRRGILMGDPLTKVILHLVNILVRVTATKVFTQTPEMAFGAYGVQLRKARTVFEAQR